MFSKAKWGVWQKLFWINYPWLQVSIALAWPSLGQTVLGQTCLPNSFLYKVLIAFVQIDCQSLKIVFASDRHIYMSELFSHSPRFIFDYDLMQEIPFGFCFHILISPNKWLGIPTKHHRLTSTALNVGIHLAYVWVKSFSKNPILQ